MTGLFQMARDALSAELDKYRNRDFMEAVMAGSALVASADGEINLTEASTLDQALETLEEESAEESVGEATGEATGAASDAVS